MSSASFLCPQKHVASNFEPALIKDLSGQYKEFNQLAADTFDMQAKEFIGLKASDINEILRYQNNDFLGPVARLDHEARNGRIASNRRVFRVQSGFVRVIDTVKHPLFSRDSDRKVNGILTIANDRTHTLTRLELLELYLQEHNTKSAAFDNFLTYLNIRCFFAKFPSPRQLVTLLVCANSRSYAVVARRMNINERTVETNMDAIRNRLHNKEELELVFRVLEGD